MVLGIGYTLRIRKRSSYLHKDSYMAQRRERTLGYEGRYRRTLSPSGMSTKAGAGDESGTHHSPIVSNSTSTGKLDLPMSPSAWERYHNIRAPNKTVIFSSHEIPNSSSLNSTHPQQPLPFHRSLSCESNVFNNKTGFSQNPMMTGVVPPVAQVAPIRGFSGPEPFQNTNCHVPDHPHVLKSSASTDTNGYYSAERQIPSLSPSVREYACDPKELQVTGHGAAGPMSQGGTSSEVSGLNCLRGSTQVDPVVPASKAHISPIKNEVLKNESTNANSDSLFKVSEPKANFALGMRTVQPGSSCTSDASSQTDSGTEEDKDLTRDSGIHKSESRSHSLTSFPTSVSSNMVNSIGTETSISSLTSAISPDDFPSYTGRQKSQEELDCDELSRVLVKQLPQGDKLQSLLVPLPDHKTTADYMEGLFHIGPQHLKKETHEKSNGSCSSLSMSSSSPEVPKESSQVAQEETHSSDSGNGTLPRTHGHISKQETNEPSSPKRCNGHAPLPADSVYFTTSECKAKFLTQYVNDMQSEPINPNDSQELKKRKEELVARIGRKLEILRIEQSEIREEIASNEQLGKIVIERVKQTAKRNEFDKFKLHVEEIEKITSLLLGLSGRLARTENALMTSPEAPNPQEKKILESKRDKLKEQLEEAKILKESIDRRSNQVSGFLQMYLSEEDFADYHHFTKMKAKLIIDAREIDDKIKLGDEQMLALQETLTSSTSTT